LRGHLAELGIVAAKRQAGVRQLLALIGEVEDDRIPPLAREMLQTLAAHLRDLETRIAGLDQRLVALARTDPVCRTLAEVPGVGPVIATAFVATVPDAGAFRSGRHLAAWLGLVPAQHSSGGKDHHLGLSKRGDGYLRRQLIHGARALVWRSPGRTAGKLWAWIHGLLARRPFNVVVAAVANKLARILWAMRARGEAYRAAVLRGRTDTLPRAARANVEVMADRSDRGQQSPCVVHERRARSHDWVLACGSHQGQRPCAPHPQAAWMAAAKTTTPNPQTKPLQGGRRPWMDLAHNPKRFGPTEG
jgi:hypothetical protein